MKKMKFWVLLIFVVLLLPIVQGCDILGNSDDDEDSWILPEKTVFVLSSSGKYISAVDYVNGMMLKKNFVELESESVATDFCVYEDKILLAATSYNALMIYSVSDGEKLREVNLGDGVKPAFVIAKNGSAYVTATEGANKLHKVDLTDYSVTSAAGGDCLQNLCYNSSDGKLYVSDIESLYSPEGKILVVDPATLQVEKIYADVHKNPQEIICDDGNVFVACVGVSWGDNMEDGAVCKIDSLGELSTTLLPGKYPACLVSYQSALYCNNGGFTTEGMTNVKDTSKNFGNLDYKVLTVEAKNEYLAITESNWSSSDGKGHLYLYRDGIEQCKIEVGDSPCCIRFCK